MSHVKIFVLEFKNFFVTEQNKSRITNFKKNNFLLISDYINPQIDWDLLLIIFLKKW